MSKFESIAYGALIGISLTLLISFGISHIFNFDISFIGAVIFGAIISWLSTELLSAFFEEKEK